MQIRRVVFSISMMGAVTAAAMFVGGRLSAQSDRAEAAQNPFAGNAGAIAAGKQLYDGACVSCHGAAARGDRGPALNTGNFQRGSADGEIFITIRSGIRGTEMPPFGQLSTDQTWQLISYLRSLAGTPVAAAAAPPRNEQVPGDPNAGKAIFAGKGGCTACHQVNGVGTAVGPDLSTAGSYTAQQLQGVILNPSQPIPAPGGPGAAPAAGGRGGGRGGRGGRGGAQTPATVTATTKDGKVYRGARKGQDALTVQMVDTTGMFRSFEKAKLANLKTDNKSIMPDNYGATLTKDELQNLVAYLKTLHGPDLSSGGKVPWERILNATKEPQNWLTYWGDLAGTHYSSLSQITAANVKNLQAQWYFNQPGDGIVEATPLVVDGIMYTIGPVGTSASVMALDAKSGRQIWRYDRPQKFKNLYEINRVNRGVSILGNRLFFGTLDSFVIALDVHTGKQLWEVQMGDTMLGYEITSPPLVLKDKIIVGIGGGEFGIRGYVDAYDPATGQRLWRSYSIPAKGEFGNDTWEGDSWEHGGAPMWLTGTYDAETNTLFWTTGNPGPDINGDVRKGDNLFSCSLLALDPDTGKRKWHYQFTPNDTHDWDSTEDVILVDRMWHGENRKLILHADRNGVFYVLDRTNGKLLQATPFVRATWVKGWDADGRPITTENWRASPEGIAIYPALGGGANFQPPSYSPQTGWFYVVYHDALGRYSIGPAPFEPGRQYQGRGTGNAGSAPPGAEPDSTGVMAIDPENGKVMWKFEAQMGLQPGVLATAGGVVFASSSEGNFVALDAKTGEPLWHFNAGVNIPSAPMSYSVEGRQHIAFSVANGLYSFALPQ